MKIDQPMGVVTEAPAVEPVQLLSYLNLPAPFSVASFSKGDANLRLDNFRPAGAGQDMTAGRATPDLQSICYDTLAGMIRMRQYEEGCALVQKGLALTTPGSFNWFKFHELFFLLCTNTEYYLKAYLLLEQTMQHPGFTKLDGHIQDEWIIYKAYVLFALHCDSASYSFYRSTDLLDRLLQQVQHMATERPLLSFSRLLLPLLLALARKDHLQLFKHITLLNKDGVEFLCRHRRLSEVCRVITSLAEKAFGASVTYALPPELHNSLNTASATEAPAADLRLPAGHHPPCSGRLLLPQIDIIPPEALRPMVLKFLT